jgi:hypothetical protein
MVINSEHFFVGLRSLLHMGKYHIFFLQITCIFKVRLNAHTKKQNKTYKIKNKTKNKTKQNKRNKKPKRK